MIGGMLSRSASPADGHREVQRLMRVPLAVGDSETQSFFLEFFVSLLITIVGCLQPL